MGRYDIPASIDYVLEKTGHQKLVYVGHSLGCTLFYIAMIQQPHLNDKIELMISLAPTTSVARLGNFFRFLAPFLGPMQVTSIPLNIKFFSNFLMMRYLMVLKLNQITRYVYTTLGKKIAKISILCRSC